MTEPYIRPVDGRIVPFQLPEPEGASAPGSSGAKYWRLRGITLTGSYLEISEVQLFANSVLQYGTLTASDTPSGNPVSALNDESLSTCCYWSSGVATNAGFWIQMSYAAPVDIDGIKLGGFDTANRFPTGFELQKSLDNATWTTVASFADLSYPGNNTLSSMLVIQAAKFATGIAGVTYSNNDRTVVASTTSEKSVYVTSAKNTGKWYIELSYFTSANTYEEDELFGAAAVANTGYYPGSASQADSSGSFGTADTRGIVSRMSGSSTSGSLSGTWNSGTNIYMVAIDFDAKKAWLGLNGTWTSGSDPATGTAPNIFNWSGTPSMKAGARLYYNQDSITIVEECAYKPAGFTAWN